MAQKTRITKLMLAPNESQSASDTDTLISLSSSPLDRTILYHFYTSTGKPWADVTRDEAFMMVTYAASLRAAFPDEDAWLSQVEAIIEDGHKAEGILFGYFNVEDDHTEEWVCDDCRADEEDAAFEEGDLAEPRPGTVDVP
jgi:hypothetical protein